MSVSTRLTLVSCLSLLAGTALAAMEATTDDGRRVRLLDDQTWEFIDSAAPETGEAQQPLISIEVVNRKDYRGSCIFGLRLQNDAPYKIINLVPQFAVYIKGDVRFDNVFVAFSSIKPTLHQYQELQYNRIRCEDITRIEVHGGDRCNMDNLTKYSPEKGECLARVRVLPSNLVNISK